jgi:hypothetical protein
MHRKQSTPWRIFLERTAVQHSGNKMWSLCDALSFLVWTTGYQGSYATMTPFRNAPICFSLCPRSARLMTVEIIVSGVTRHLPSLTNAVHAIHLMISSTMVQRQDTIPAIPLMQNDTVAYSVAIGLFTPNRVGPVTRILGH